MSESLLEKLTGEILDSCVSLRNSDLMQFCGQPFASAAESDAVLELRHFERLIHESEFLRDDILAILVSLYEGKDHSLSGMKAAKIAVLLSESRDRPRNIPVLYSALNVMSESARGNFITCLETLFYLGWHARGAIEDQERLPKL